MFSDSEDLSGHWKDLNFQMPVFWEIIQESQDNFKTLTLQVLLFPYQRQRVLFFIKTNPKFIQSEFCLLMFIFSHNYNFADCIIHNTLLQIKWNKRNVIPYSDQNVFFFFFFFLGQEILWLYRNLVHFKPMKITFGDAYFIKHTITLFGFP